MSEFTECDSCRAKTGMPTLCSGCLANRKLISELKRQLADFAPAPRPPGWEPHDNPPPPYGTRRPDRD